jgi:hypothetical protein
VYNNGQNLRIFGAIEFSTDTGQLAPGETFYLYYVTGDSDGSFTTSVTTTEPDLNEDFPPGGVSAPFPGSVSTPFRG